MNARPRQECGDEIVTRSVSEGGCRGPTGRRRNRNPKRKRGGTVVDDPLGFFLTWVTYGTWLPGDARGWVEYRHGWQLPDPVRELEAAARMTEDGRSAEASASCTTRRASKRPSSR
jgi:hypothetical protein